MRHIVDDVRRIVGRPCSYLPLAADVLRFAPFPDPPPRAIHVCNIGRRSSITHEALLNLARKSRLFYYYDTVMSSDPDKRQRTFRVEDAAEHRLLLASLLQRSRYYIANRSRINEPDFTMGRDEISGRFYEGAAAGTIMIGEAPRTEEFARQFDWPDAVVDLPFDSRDAACILGDLDKEPGRLARIRRNAIHAAALRHDWVCRLRTVFETLGIPVTEGMIARERQLGVVAANGLEGAEEEGEGLR